MSLIERVQSVVAEKLSVDEDEVIPDASFTEDLTKLSGFVSILSTRIKITEKITRKKREKRCFVSVLKKAERIAIPTSSRLVSIKSHFLQLLSSY